MYVQNTRVTRSISPVFIAFNATYQRTHLFNQVKTGDIPAANAGISPVLPPGMGLMPDSIDRDAASYVK